MKLPLLLSLLAAVTLSAAPATPTAPPVFDKTHQGFTFSVDVEGNFPTTYQWYRGTKTEPKKYKIAAPQGIQRVLEFGPPWGIPYVAGEYRCEGTNAAGSALSDPFQVATTKTLSAPKMKITHKIP